ncbi:MAG: adenylate/guanylate cyclase domain-containing protein [Magnetococcus sp. YQC-9]
MSRLFWIRLLTGTVVSLVFVLHALGIAPLPPLARLESLSYDWRMRVDLPDTRDNRIVIVDIDEKSIARLGRWPWGRHQLAQLTDTLFDHYRILTLTFDMLFPDRDDSSGLAHLERLAAGALRNQADFLYEYQRLRPSLERDERFAKALSGRPVILGHYFRAGGVRGATNPGVLPEPIITLAELGQENLPVIHPEGFGANLEILQKAAQGGGFLDNPLVDPDGVHRFIPLLQEFKGGLYQSLALGTVRTILGDPPVTLGIASEDKGRPGAHGALEWIGLGPHRIPVDARGAIPIPYRTAPGGFLHLSALDVLEKNVRPESLNDAIVLIGSALPGMMDLHATPLHPFYPGVEIHATIISGILDGLIKRHAGSTNSVIELGYLLLLAVLFLGVVPRLKPIWGVYITLIVWILILWSNALLWRRADLIVPLSTPMLLTLLLAGVHGLFVAFSRQHGDSRLTRLMAPHLSAGTLTRMHQTDATATLQGAQREISVLFVGIRDFVQVSAPLAPESLKRLLDRYLTRITRMIHAHHGTLDHFRGELIMGFWGAPMESTEHAREALRCALELARFSQVINDEFRAEGLPPVHISIGLESGLAWVGELGSDSRSTYTALGTTVEQARRLELLGKRYGVTIAIGQAMRAQVPEAICRILDRIHAHGTHQPVTIFEPLGLAGEIAEETLANLERYHEALRLYETQRWEEARSLFQWLAERDPERSIHELYLSRIQHLSAHPPQPDWDGVFQTRFI